MPGLRVVAHGARPVNVLVGCPVLMREWCLPDWFARLDDAAVNAHVNLEFVFVGAAWDQGTWDAIDTGAAGRPLTRVVVDEDRRTRSRDWLNPARYHRMVELRNTLLTHVRDRAPDLFLSLDSDILLHPDALANVIDTASRFDAVAAGVDLRVNTPNYFVTGLRGHERPPAPGVVTRVDVIMAAKLMGPAAYHVDYRWHRQGEDIGWSQAAGEAGLTLGWDNRAPSPHVTDPPAHLREPDAMVSVPSGGWTR